MFEIEHFKNSDYTLQVNTPCRAKLDHCLVTCSLTLVVSNGKVNTSAIHAPAPALTTLTHRGVGVPASLWGRECSW